MAERSLIISRPMALIDKIERFYARNLPLSKEMAINLRVWEWLNSAS